jgi:predicted kinase
VIADATFLRRANRADFRHLAAIHGAALRVVHCDAPEAVLRERIERRAALRTDPSEATPSVLDWQRARVEPIAPEEGLAVIEADTTRAEVADLVRAQLDAQASRSAFR